MSPLSYFGRRSHSSRRRTQDWLRRTVNAQDSASTVSEWSPGSAGSAATAAMPASASRETEAGFQRWCLDLALTLGWRVYHTHDSRRSEPGFPDLVLVRERVLFREVKTQQGRMRPEQQTWLDLLTKAGADAKVWRPADRRSILEELRRV